ncbi:transmembrane emp24 domain-containing protein 6-like, partial [Ctenopharyngodon idella]|uniref:transmembrane emp24 domain-containing protein 6-like n=1 Tax=Ctenopharyngodon idella TaxID=7959 RepID=UPI0022309B5D
FGLSNSGALKDPHPELSDQELFWTVDQYDFVIMLCAGDLQCFWHFAHYGESFYLHFMKQWLSGDCVALDRHLSVIVNAPSGLIIGTADDESAQIVFSVEETAGFYQMCFSNFHNRFGIMQVFLNFGVYYEGQEKKKEEEDMKQINISLSFIVVINNCI